MDFSFIFFLNSMLLGVGLAMDAFSVSLANGLLEPDMRFRRSAAIAGVYAVFQAVMPMAGWICVHTVVQAFKSFEKAIPWIALFLLAYIGGKMIYEGIKNNGEGSSKKLTVKVLLIQGIATSIDALSVGFTISSYEWYMALVECVIISVVTFAICLAGLKIGKTIGTKWSSGAALLGGAILIAIGLEIFITGLCF